MTDGFFYIRNKKTGQISRTLAKPFLGPNGAFELLPEEETSQLFGRKKKAKPAPAPKKAAEPFFEVDELGSGLSDGEDG